MLMMALVNLLDVYISVSVEDMSHRLINFVLILILKALKLEILVLFLRKMIENFKSLKQEEKK